MKRFVIVSFIAGIVGCSGSDRVVHEAARPCAPETVDAYCARHSCQTFDETAAAVRSQGEDAVKTGALYRYTIGTCGSML